MIELSLNLVLTKMVNTTLGETPRGVLIHLRPLFTDPLTGRLGNDFTVVTFPNGTKRAYFKVVEGWNQQLYLATKGDSQAPRGPWDRVLSWIWQKFRRSSSGLFNVAWTNSTSIAS